MEPVIELRNITKRFDMRQETSSLWRFLTRKNTLDTTQGDGHKVVLDNLSLTVNRGERLAIIGRNGAGKSTLLKLISKILLPDSGTVTVRGTISSLLELGVGFHPELNGSENIYFYGALMGKNRAQVAAVYDDICEFADIGNYIEQPVKTYSSGMYQRLAFSCAFAMQPSILIADEGLSVGDFLFQQKCFDRIEQIVAQGTTFLMVAHSARQVQRIATRGIWLENGRIEMDGEINAVQDAYTKFLLYERNILASSQHSDTTQIAPGIEQILQSGEPDAPRVSQTMVEFNDIMLIGNNDPWPIGQITTIVARVALNISSLQVRFRVQIIDAADDLPLVENHYMRDDPATLMQGLNYLKIQLPPTSMKQGAYRCVLEVYDSEGAVLLAKSAPVMLFSKRPSVDGTSAYIRNPRITVELTDDDFPMLSGDTLRT